jgi:xanthomonalisin
MPEAKPQNTQSKAMTWSMLEDKGNGIVLVWHDGVSNPYQWDTSTSESLPLLCIKKWPEYSAVPQWLTVDFYFGWWAGSIALSKSYVGKDITSRANADSKCAADLWAGWEFAQFHHSLWGWRWYAYGDANALKWRFWVGIRDQASNPWGAWW